MPELPLRGGCMCGGVRFEVTEAPAHAGYCHCRRCQRRTGTAASISARIAPGSLRILEGEELIKAYEPEDGFHKLFCSVCGSALWSRHPTDPDVISVRLGAFDDDPGVRPSYRQFVAYAAPWEPLPDDGLERFPERRPS
ncbi:MAG: GFA family protein [Actinobacteria bacterium]|nr:MAG: GFA family protein [Actinomycetota bacterium]